MRAEEPAMLSKLRTRAREAAKAMGARRKDLSVKNEPPSLDDDRPTRDCWVRAYMILTFSPTDNLDPQRQPLT